MNRSNANLLIALCLIIIGVSLRILPHPDNFAPMAAIAIFGGSVLLRRYGLWIPVVAMVASDLILGFHNLILVTWGSYFLIAFAASRWLQKLTLVRGAVFTMAASIFFFVVTNFAVWIESGMYAHTLNGLAECYAMALPFFRNTLISDLFYTGVLFGSFMLATRLSGKLLKPDRIRATG